MKLKHGVVILIFIGLAISAGIYLHTKRHASFAKVEDIYPENVAEKYYKSLSERDGRNIGMCMISSNLFQRWHIFDAHGKKNARLTTAMMKNIRYFRLKSLKKIYVDKSVCLTRKNGEIYKFPKEDTVIYEAVYDISYFDTKDKAKMYSKYRSIDYKDLSRSFFKNEKEKIWLVKIEDGSWKIVKIEA